MGGEREVSEGEVREGEGRSEVSEGEVHEGEGRSEVSEEKSLMQALVS